MTDSATTCARQRFGLQANVVTEEARIDSNRTRT